MTGTGCGAFRRAMNPPPAALVALNSIDTVSALQGGPWRSRDQEYGEAEAGMQIFGIDTIARH
ncbi:hypothetical protein F6P96_00810 [Escherichia coli]|nr:hypothetical protein F6P96_00810 [Escherichia coli]